MIVVETAPWDGEIQRKIREADPQNKFHLAEIGNEIKILVERTKITVANLQWISNWQEMCMYGVLTEFCEKFGVSSFVY
jgi:hypothetical protein